MNKLIDIIDSDLVSNDELLKPYLSHHADNKMKTIVESIQKEQNQIMIEQINDNWNYLEAPNVDSSTFGVLPNAVLSFTKILEKS